MCIVSINIILVRLVRKDTEKSFIYLFTDLFIFLLLTLIFSGSTCVRDFHLKLLLEYSKRKFSNKVWFFRFLSNKLILSTIYIYIYIVLNIQYECLVNTKSRSSAQNLLQKGFSRILMKS